MAKLVHTMVRVRDEARATGFYRQAFGLEVEDRLAFDGFTLVYMRTPDSTFELELTINDGKAEPYDLGNGYGHLAVVVDDIAAEHARFEAEGLAPGALKEMQYQGALLARFFFVTDPDGYKIEVLQKHGRFH